MGNRGRRMDNGRYIKCYDKKLTKEYLQAEYPKKGANKIADELGINVKTVYNYLSYYKIPTITQTKKIQLGDRFGKLVILGKAEQKKTSNTIKWRCKCDCGNIVETPTTNRLLSKRTRSCGCNKKQPKNHRWTGYCGVSGGRVSEIRFRAKKRNLEFDLDPKFLWELFMSQDKKCAITGTEIDLTTDGSIDRIDNNRGYTKDNVWWVIKDINKLKLDFTLDRFIELCEMVVNNKEKIQDGR